MALSFRTSATSCALAVAAWLILAGLAANAWGQSPYEAGRRFLEEKKYDRALHQASRILRENPRDPYGHHLKGLAHYFLGQYLTARNAFLRSMETAPDPSGIRTSARRNAAMASTELANQVQGEGRIEEARTLLEQAREIDPEYGLAVLRHGMLLMYLLEYDRGAEILRRFLMVSDSGPKDRALAHYRLGTMAMDDGDLGRAKARFRRALEEDPNLEQAKFTLDQAEKSIEAVHQTIQAETRIVWALVGVLLGYGIAGFLAFRFLRRREVL